MNDEVSQLKKELREAQRKLNLQRIKCLRDKLDAQENHIELLGKYEELIELSKRLLAINKELIENKKQRKIIKIVRNTIILIIILSNFFF